MRKENPNIRALKLLHSFCPSYFPLLTAKTFFDKLTPYFNLYMSAEVVNEIVGARDRDRLILLVMITVLGNFAIAIIGGILNRIFGHKETILNQRETAYFNRKTLTLDYADLENTEVRQLRRKITESAKINCHGKQLLIMCVSSFISITISALLSLMLGIEMFALIFAAGFDWYVVLFAAILISVMAFYIWYEFLINDKFSCYSAEVSQTMIDENRIDDAVDCYNMGKDVRLYRQDKLIMKVKRYCLDLHKKAYRNFFGLLFRINTPTMFANAIIKIVVHIFVCSYAIAGVFGIGSIIKYAEFVKGIINCILSYSDVCSNLKTNTEFVEDYLAYFDIPRNMYQGKVPVEKWFMCDGGDNEYEIEFRNVSFKYPSTDFYALKNVCMKFKVGQRLAVVGMNGSGKTTFIKLLCRLYDPTEGEILLNGVNIKKYDYDDYLALFSVVFQDFKLFSFPLGQNVAVSASCDDDKVRNCLEQAGFGERLNAMPDGIDTCLYKDFDVTGVEISGGEAQKIALARALYKDAPFIVLDEPTAALDPIAEFEIYSKFNDIVEDKTAIYISHRLSSCRFCDCIAVFDNGQIVQRGSHDELVADESGKYHELWFAQAQYYTDTQNT